MEYNKTELKKYNYLIGQKIKAIRDLKGFKQDYVAEKLGISSGHYSNLENGHKTCTLYILIRLCRILDFGRAYSFEICIYFDGYTLLESMRQGNCFDIIFMDIEMKKIDGIRAAKTIREIDEDVQLIYISGYEEYALQLFEMRPIGFLKKPLYPDQFRQCLKKALDILETRILYFSYRNHYRENKIRLKDIFYFESIYRKIYIHTKQGTDYFYGKLSDTEEELENSVIPFIRIHQSYLVNYHHISQYQSSKIIMESGAELTVSTAHRAYVKEKIHELLRLD